MSRCRIALVLAACCSLIALQTAGIHVHVSAIGEEAAVHALQHAGAFAHPQHDVGRDVPLLEKLGIFSSKLVPLVSIVALMVAALWRRVHSRHRFLHLARGGCQLRLRPPLRAPPSTW